MAKKWVYGILALVLSALVIYTSLNTGATYDAAGGRIGAWINRYIFASSLNAEELNNLTGFGAKFIGHFWLFAFTGLFTYLLCKQFPQKKTLFAALFLLYGVILSSMGEVTQIFSEGRSPTFGDVVLDFSGFMLFPIWQLFYRAFSRSAK